jgi:hypothetical protein
MSPRRTSSNGGADNNTSVKVGDHIYRAGRIYRVVAREEGTESNPLFLPTVDLGTSARTLIDYPQLIMESGSGDDPPIVASSYEAVVAELARRKNTDNPPIRSSNARFKVLQDNASRMLETVRSIEEAATELQRLEALGGGVLTRTAALKMACKARKPRPIVFQTYYNLRKAIRKWDADPDALAAAQHRSTYNKTKRDSASQHYVDTMCLKFLGRHRNMRPKAVYREFVEPFAERLGNRWIDVTKCQGDVEAQLVHLLLNPLVPVEEILKNKEFERILVPIKLPHINTFAGYANWFMEQPGEGQEVIIERYGRKKWDDEHMVFDTYANRADLPLQFVFADHHLIDIFTVDENDPKHLTRLWWTVFIDAYSRSVLGMVLLDEDPSTMSIQQGLRHSIYFKTSHTELGIEGDWFSAGIPMMLFLDNAWAHHAKSLQNLCMHISQGTKFQNIHLVWRVPYMARRGALIESLFGKFEHKIKDELRNRGAILSSHPKDIAAARRTACLLNKDIWYLLNLMVVEYQNTVHSALDGLTPNQKWLSYWGDDRLPKIPPLTPEIERLFLREYKDPRLKTDEGMAAFGMHYWSPKLHKLPSVDKAGPILYTIRYDPADISRISVFAGSKYLCDAFAKERRLSDGSYDPISEADRNLRQSLSRLWKTPTGHMLKYHAEFDSVVETRVADAKEHKKWGKGRGRKPKDAQDYSLANARKASQALTEAMEEQALSVYLGDPEIDQAAIDRMRTERLKSWGG